MARDILIVDDERSTREGLRSALEEEFDVYLAAGTTEAMHGGAIVVQCGSFKIRIDIEPYTGQIKVTNI